MSSFALIEQWDRNIYFSNQIYSCRFLLNIESSHDRHTVQLVKNKFAVKKSTIREITGQNLSVETTISLIPQKYHPSDI